jgi:dihydrofolate reductase
MIVSSIVLTDQDNAIGKNHLILDYLPNFVEYFHELTKDAPVIMGRRTFENVGHILKSRKNVVITRNEKYHSIKARTFHTMREALLACSKKEKKVFIIGSAGLFLRALPYTSEIYRTCITAKIRANNYYPEIDTSLFDLKSAECISADEKNRFQYCIERWIRSEPARPLKK